MVSIKVLASALAAFTTFATASPTLEVEAEKRNSSPVTLAITPDGACTQSFIFNGQVTPGTCTTFSRSGNFGAFLSTPGEQCVFKFWTGAGCTGQATTWYAPPNSDSHCIPIANNGGVFKLGGGVESVLVNCATDQVP